jgi:hypothetical protein
LWRLAEGADEGAPHPIRIAKPGELRDAFDRLAGRLHPAPPHQQAMLVRGTQDQEHAMAEALKKSIAVVGIDIGKKLVPRCWPR